MINHVGGDFKALRWVKPQSLFETCKFLSTQLGAVNLAGVLLAWRRPADDGAKRDQGWLIGVCLGLLNCVIKGRNVFVVIAASTPVNLEGLPAVGTVSSCNILGKGDVGVVFNRDLVGVINGNQISKTEVSSD